MLHRYLLAVCLCCVSCSILAANCASDRIDERLPVSYVFDGDTLKLADERRLRLIGIDTPEISHRGQAAQAYGVQASNALRTLLAANPAVGLRYDAERQDRYQRTLAHVFLADGRSVEGWLLEQGLATLFPVPPNTWNLACYQAAERLARHAKRGLWSLPRYQPLESHALPATAHGYYLLKGRVLEVKHSRKALWLKLSEELSLRIDKRDFGYFDLAQLEQSAGANLLVSGWVTARGGKSKQRRLQMHIRHPATLDWLQ